MLSGKKKKGNIRSLLKKPRTFQKNENKLSQTEKKIIKKLKNLNTATGQAHTMKLSIQGLYRTTGEAQALLGFRAWIKWLKQTSGCPSEDYIMAPMRSLAQSVDNHLTGIIARWRHGTSNGILEGINSVFSAVKRQARGFKSREYLKWMLYLTAGNLIKIPSLFH